MNKFGEVIRAKREEKNLLLRQVAFSLDMDVAMLSKIELGFRNAKREHVIILSKILEINEKELLTLWLADKVYEIIEEEENALEAMKVAESEIRYLLKKN